MFEYDKNLSVQRDARYTQPRLYNLDALNITTRKVLDVGIIAQVAMEKTGFEGSEDYSDLFDSVGILLQYAANRMLNDVYARHEGEDHNAEQFAWSAEKMTEVHDSLLCIEQFNLIGKLVK